MREAEETDGTIEPEGTWWRTWGPVGVGLAEGSEMGWRGVCTFLGVEAGEEDGLDHNVGRFL